MKKAAIVVILITILALFSTTALAVEKVSGNSSNLTTVVENTKQTANFLLTNTGKVCGLLFGEKLSTVSINETAPNITGYSKDNGKLVRYKGGHYATLTPESKLLDGGSTIEIVKLEILASTPPVLNENVNAIIDATIVAEELGDNTYRAYHRFFDKDVGQEVAKLYITDSYYISVRYADWDGDGDLELGLRAGLSKSSSGGSGGGGSDDGDSGDGGSGDGGSGNGGSGNGGSDSGNETPGNTINPPDPHYRDWPDNNSDSSNSNSGPKPDPHYRDF